MNKVLAVSLRCQPQIKKVTKIFFHSHLTRKFYVRCWLTVFRRNFFITNDDHWTDDKGIIHSKKTEKLTCWSEINPNWQFVFALPLHLRDWGPPGAAGQVYIRSLLKLHVFGSHLILNVWRNWNNKFSSYK